MTLPLNGDGLTDLIVVYIDSKYFQDFLGTLDGGGQAVPRFESPGMSAAWIGFTFHFAAAYADTLLVPGKYATIQEAIGASSTVVC